MLRLVKTGRIQQRDLRTGGVHDPKNSCPCCLWLVRHNRDLFVQQPVEQRRLADIRASDDRNGTEFHTPTGVTAPVMSLEPIDRLFHLSVPIPTVLLRAVRFSLDRVRDGRSQRGEPGRSVPNP